MPHRLSDIARNETEARTASSLNRRLRSLAARAIGIASRHHMGRQVHPQSDLPPTAEGDLAAAAAGHLGVDDAVAEVCGRALADWQAALRERAERQATRRRGGNG